MLSRALRSRCVKLPRPSQSSLAYRQLYSRIQPVPPSFLGTSTSLQPIWARSFSSFRDYKPKRRSADAKQPQEDVTPDESKSHDEDSSPKAANEPTTTPETESELSDAKRNVEDWIKSKVNASEDVEEQKVKEAVKQAEDKFNKKQESSSSSTFSSSSNSDKKEKKKSSNDKSKDEQNNNQYDSTVTWIITGAALFWIFTNRLDSAASFEEISVAEFCTRLMNGDPIAKIVVRADKETVAVFLSGEMQPSFIISVGSIESFERVMKEVQYAAGLDPNEFIPVYFEPVPNSVNIQGMMELAFIGAVMYAFYIGFGMLGKGGGMGGKNPFSMGKATFKAVMPGDKTSVRFADVAGLGDAKVEVMEFVSFLKDPDRFTKLGAKVPKGALLVGPPGTGKTLLAKATAGEAGVPFYSVSGSEFLEMFVGVGPARVRDLFKEARENKPSIIFVDEIDAVGRARSNDSRRGGSNDERENTLNQLLVEMDGFSSDSGVIVLAGTNRADVLDKALTRPGRFDRTIQIDNPDIQGRVQIFGVHLRNLKTANDKNDLSPKLAALTPGFSGADIANICNEAAIIAGRAEKEAVDEVDFEAAVDRVIGGLAKKGLMNEAEKKLVAYHEAGHAVVGWFLEHADPLLKVTIVPRGGGALGFAQYLPKELMLYQQDQLQDRMCVMLGGRAAEQIAFGKVSTGASDDLQKVMQLANNVVTRFGMTGALPNLAYQPQDQFNKPFSEATASKVDREIFEIIGDSYTRTLALLEEKRDELEALAQKLMELETINHQHIVDCLGPRPFKTDAYLEFLSNEHKQLPPMAKYNITETRHRNYNITTTLPIDGAAADTAAEDAAAEDGAAEEAAAAEDAAAEDAAAEDAAAEDGAAEDAAAEDAAAEDAAADPVDTPVDTAEDSDSSSKGSDTDTRT